MNPNTPSARYPHFDYTNSQLLQSLVNQLLSTDKDLHKHGFTMSHLTAIYPYCDKDGSLLYFKPRFDKDGKKWIKPCWYDGNRFYLGEPTGANARYNPKAKPLYNLPQLATLPQGEMVYFVEGEKCANALMSIGIFAVTAGASSSTNNTDLTPLQGYQVRLWRDYDTAGQKWLHDMATALDGLNIAYDVVDVDKMAQAEPLNPSDDAFDVLQRWHMAGVNASNAHAQIKTLPTMSQQDFKSKQTQNTTMIPPTAQNSNGGNEGDKWGEIVPFDEVKNIETPFPVDAFPPLLAKVVQKVAYYQQVPLSMAGFGVLGAISHIGQGFIDAPYINSDYNPASLFLVVQGESGSGKTQTIKITHKAIIDHEKVEYELYKDEKRSYDNELSSKTKKEIKSFHEQNNKPTDPRSMFGSGSIQKVMQGFTDGNYQNASYTADEGANLLEGASLKAETAGASIGAICDIYSKGIAERVTINNTGNQVAYNVRLTLFLSGQDVTIKPALNNPRLTQQGLLPRCLFAFPPDNRGNRQLITDNFTTDATLQTYWKKCQNFLELPLKDGKRKRLAWTAPALKIAQDYWCDVEKSQQKGGMNHNAKAYASRMVENATRLGALFAWFNDKHGIDTSDIEGAIKIVNYSANERRRYDDITTDITDAEKLLQWLIKKAHATGKDKFYYSYLQTNAPKHLTDKETLNNALELLSDSNYIYLDTETTNRRPKRTIELNPALLPSQ
ncbi:DUF3987 domain-containing protein [Moraxella bovis]|uniref:DUF3987 domain-containing protein n=1 Tax=Moraxella bovis TaxID=476 RepID=UPI002226B32C|nr:DUF3987 domain-containing protein [Moraxella bovis]UZA17381.1 DUF3987 domain-containing protein [Moraxella bovis]